MNDRLYVSGVPGAVNLYFVCSERLRDRGWHGVGDAPGWWLAPAKLAKESMSFTDALRKTGIGQFYAWEVQRFLIERSMIEFGERMRPKFDAVREAAERLGKSMVSQLSPTFTKKRVSR